jgi:hypothetical protein
VTDPYERVRNRKLPSLPFRVLVVDGDELEVAQRKLLEATERKRRAERNLVPEKPERVKEAESAKRALSRAEKAFESCWETIRITAIEPATYEALRAEYPPTPEQLKDDPEAEYGLGFRAALLAACAEGGKTVDDWADMLEHQFSTGERQELFTTALAVNAGTRVVESVVLPKDSNGILGLLSKWR